MKTIVITDERRFQAFKVSRDGNHTKWGFVSNLTHDEARDLDRFPGGVLREPDGTPYIWTYSLMPAWQ